MIGTFSEKLKGSTFAGLYLILIYCCFATSADAITRTISQKFEAPQLFFFSGGIVAIISLLMNLASPAKGALVSKRPYSLALRSGLIIFSAVCYFFAFRMLGFAEVFVFIALVPIFSALLSGPILGEPVGWQSWMALGAGVIGMILLYPQGLSMLGLAHLSAFSAAFFGASSMVLARHISRDDDNALLQVLYPNIAMFVVMGCVLPFVFKPMSYIELALVALYAVMLFLARWVLVLALARIEAYVVTLLINLQFVVMVIAGVFVFEEIPSVNLILGASVIVLASVYIFMEHHARRTGKSHAALHRKAGSTAT